jgi:hypothetical protein
MDNLRSLKMKGQTFIAGLTVGVVATATAFRKPIKRCLLRTIHKEL